MLVNAKSQLAKLMATENITVEQRKVQTAAFNLRDRILTLPILDGNISSDLYDLLVGHEVGHALNTPAEGWHDSVVELKIPRFILNVVEDTRIEKLIKRKYPGIRKSFLTAYNNLFNERDFFGVRGKNLNTLNFIDRLNLYEKCGAATGITFSEEEQLLVQEVENAESWEQVKNVSLKIQEYMKNASEPEEKAKIYSHSFDGVDGDQSSDDFEMNEKLLDLNQDSDETEIEKDEENDEDEDEENENKLSDSLTGNGLEDFDPDKQNDHKMKSITDETFRQREKELYQENAKPIQYLDIPEMLIDNIIVDYKKVYAYVDKFYQDDFVKNDHWYQEKIEIYRHKENVEDYMKFKNSTTNVVNYLVKEFELRKNADQMKRATVAKTGVLNMSKLYSYKFNEDLFKKIAVIPGGKSHGLIMFVDWSGSMQNHIHNTVKQLINLVMFCRKVNIPFEVYSFTDRTFGDGVIRKYDFDYSGKSLLNNVKPNTMLIGCNTFSLINIFSSKMTGPELNKAFQIMYHVSSSLGRRYRIALFPVPDIFILHGTPLNEAILAAMQIIPKFRTDNNLQMVNTVFLTDGDGHMFNHYLDHNNKYSSFNIDSKNRTVIRDPKTKASFVIDVGEKNCMAAYRMFTKAMLHLLKNRVECNIVGFFVTDNYGFRDIREDISAKIIDNKSAIVTGRGYDEYYVIKSSSMNTDEFETFESDKQTTRGLATDFKKFNQNKFSSRVILNRFIDMVA